MTDWKACAVCKDQACVNCEECGPCYGIRLEAEARIAELEAEYEKLENEKQGWFEEAAHAQAEVKRLTACPKYDPISPKDPLERI